MLVFLLLPLIPVVWWLATRSVEDALIDVFLPVMIVVPTFYVLHIPHLLGLTAHNVALLPIVIVAFARYGRQWRLKRSDLWIALFVIGAGYAAGRDNATEGLRVFFETSFAVFLPYAVGRLLLEQDGVRVRFLRRLCWLVAFVAILSVIEFRLSRNLFTITFGKIFSQAQLNMEQIRGGFTRTQGPFTHAITAGIVYGATWIFALWLKNFSGSRLKVNEPRFWGVRHSVILVGLLFMGLLIAYSRGPWVGAVLSFGIWLIARSKHVKRTTIIVVTATVILGGFGYTVLKVYTSGTAQTIDQQNAIYRRQLLEVYGDIASEGGLFGWGMAFPQVANQDSIDNEYLFLHLTQGTLGLWTFAILSFESCLALILWARKATQKTEFAFSLTLLAVLGGILVTISSVSLSSQAQEIFFFCIGWSFALRPPKTEIPTDHQKIERQYRFQRIFA